MNGRSRPCGPVVATLVVTLLASALCQESHAYLTPAERQALDLPYEVRDPDESYFDVAARMELLQRTDDPLIRRIVDQLEMGLSCRNLKAQPVLNGKLTLPSFYDNPAEWSLTVEPLLAFEQTMSDLSAAWVATGDRYYADCLVDILEHWAKEEALYEFDFDLSRPQAWYAIESMIFSAALAFSTVTGQAEIEPARRKTITDWLVKTAKVHFNTPGTNPSCCNNHYYRRALYMTIVGVVADDDLLFRTGLRSIYSALDDLNAQGGLSLAIKRGWRAIHYQNYSLLYLVTTMQIAYRQGYDLFKLKVNGRGFEQAVDFLMQSLASPYSIEGLPPGEQDLSFVNDAQYFSWMEIWLSHFDHQAMERFVRLYRPTVNRGAGGYTTLFFKRPERPQAIAEQTVRAVEAARAKTGALDVRYPLLEKWRLSQ